MDFYKKKGIKMNKDFYPTPKHLANRMIDKIKFEAKTFLDGQAGKGDLLDAIGERCGSRRIYTYAIEIDPDLQSILKGKRYKVIDSDFLLFSGPDKFDVIIGNPPFDEGGKHLLKAIDMMYSGQIVYIINAETIRNPYTNTRKLLQKKLSELNAEIEFIESAFMLPGTERKTPVEIALISIVIDRKVEVDLFEELEHAQDIEINEEIDKEDYEVATKNKIGDLVAEYNRVINIGIETLVGFYKNYKIVGKYIQLKDDDSVYRQNITLTTKMKDCVNDFVHDVRKDFWKKALNLEEIRKRLTNKQRDLFNHLLDDQSNMDFTENNIRQFVINLINNYDKYLKDAVVALFDEFTRKYAWDENLHKGNIHYFNGWKSNNAFKVNKKIVIPYMNFTDGIFSGQKWRISYETRNKLYEFDIVMNYFDRSPYYMSLIEAIEKAFEKNQNTKIKSTYFTVNCYKKGTIHVTFNDENILRRFNICTCKEKGWLPFDYAKKRYAEMDKEEQEVVKSFEDDVNHYHKNVGLPDFSMKKPKMIA